MTSEPASAGGNLWTATCAEQVAVGPIAGRATADLVVIGGGFTGCSAALAAAEAGASVIVLEAETIGHGGSGRNVGLVNAGLWLKPDAVAAKMGEDSAARLLSVLSAGPQTVFDLIERHGIACEPTRAGTLHCAHSAAGLSDLQDRHRQGNRQGAPLQLLDAAETARRTGARGLHGALLDSRAGTIQPRAYVTGLARAATAAGARLHAGSLVTGASHEGGVWRVTTVGGEVAAPALLVATNGYHRFVRGLSVPATVPVWFSQFATAPLPAKLRARILPGSEGCWDTSTVMRSWRVDAAGRLILGTMGDVAGPGGRLHAAWARRTLATLFPEARDMAFEHTWQGRIAMTGDHIPKLLRLGPRATALFGFSGRGIVPGTLLGAAAARHLLGGPVTDLPLPLSDAHRETFPTLQSAALETGATLIHAFQARA